MKRIVCLTAFALFAAPTWALDLNKANRSELEQLPRVGVARAEVILSERERNGPFASWDDFRRRVPGFRSKSIDALKAQGVEIGPSASRPTQPGTTPVAR